MLRSGEMTFFDLMEFAAEIGLNAVDLTGYYFHSYPEIPQNSELFRLKRRALELGLNISWTGVRNNFVNPDPDSRKADSDLIRKWLTVSTKLGASIMRVFTGKHSYDGFTKNQVKEWLVEEYKICAGYGEESGGVVGLQNHNEFLFQSDEIIDLLKRVDSEWFGLILDIGSLHAANPYDEIEKLAPYANYWFIKEHVFPNGIKTAVDMAKLATIIKNQGYQGYISFESLSEGDPKQIVSSMFNAFKAEYEKL
jgi:sugar phosphate isomerase/epimerase